MLLSLVPNLLKKAAHYQLPATGTSYAHNVSIIARTFLTKRYSVCWWKNCCTAKPTLWICWALHLQGSKQLCPPHSPRSMMVERCRHSIRAIKASVCVNVR